MGNYLQKVYSKFDSILTDSLSLIKLMETSRFHEGCFFYLQLSLSLYTNIPVNDALKYIIELVEEYENDIPNALLNFCKLLKNSLMTFDS